MKTRAVSGASVKLYYQFTCARSIQKTRRSQRIRAVHHGRIKTRTRVPLDTIDSPWRSV